MSKQENIEAYGLVTELLGFGNYKVKLDLSDSEVLAQLSGKMKKFYIKVLPGDRVLLELSPYDLTRGRIISRLKPEKDETN